MATLPSRFSCAASRRRSRRWPGPFRSICWRWTKCRAWCASSGQETCPASVERSSANGSSPGLAAASQDVVIGDGGFGFFDYPDGQRALATALHSALKPSGLFVYRHYAQANEGETVDNVVAAANAGAIGNFHIFKWRIAMALQSESEDGVRARRDLASGDDRVTGPPSAAATGLVTCSDGHHSILSRQGRASVFPNAR